MSTAAAAVRRRREVNGVDLDTLFETMTAIEKVETIARFRFEARNLWEGGALNRTTIDEFEGACQRHTRPSPFVFVADEPPVLVGKDRGANPVEALLHALAACVTTSLVYHAAAQGIRIRRIESQLDGDLDVRGFLGMSAEVRNGFRQVRMSMKIDADATAKQIDELIALATARSPVFDMISHGVPVVIAAAH
jgi:uncharacterized OsmC-like protein